MNTFFNDFLDEVESRYGEKLTLTSKKEVEIFHQVRQEYEAGTLGRNIEKNKRRIAKEKNKPKSEKINLGILTKKIYKNKELYLDSKDSLRLLKEGYRKGAEYNAMGNIGSAFNETMSNEGVLILDKFTLPLPELAKVIYYRTLNTELGKQQKDSPRNGISIPDEIPRVSQNLYIASYLAAKSAIVKSLRSRLGELTLKQKIGFEIKSRMCYGGSSNDIKTLSEKIITADKCFIFDMDLKKIVEIPRLQMLKWTQSAGSGKNPGDTVVVITDVYDNILYDGWSDKKALNDIQGNGTLNDEITKISRRIETYFNNGLISADSYKKINELTEFYKESIFQIEDGYKNSAIGEAKFMLSLDDMYYIPLWMDLQETWYRKNKTTNHIKVVKKLDNHHGAANKDYMKYLLYNVDKSSTRSKIVNRISIMYRSWLKRNKQEIPQTLDTKGIVSISRNSVMTLHSELYEKLNEFQVDDSKLGNLLLLMDTVDLLHISKINKPNGYDDFKQFLNRNTIIVMAGIPVTPDVIKSSLEIEDVSQIIVQKNFGSEERLVYDNGKKYITGKVVKLYTETKEGIRKILAEKTYRSKQGFSGKTSNTIIWSPEIQEKFGNFDSFITK